LTYSLQNHSMQNVLALNLDLWLHPMQNKLVSTQCAAHHPRLPRMAAFPLALGANG
jgi:hypothetical protein